MKNFNFFRVVFLFIPALINILPFGKDSGGVAFSQGYSVTSFTKEWCSVSIFPTSYNAVSTFSINETTTDGFRKNQTSATLILNLAAGFEFNTAVGTVTFPAGRDISSLLVSSFTSNSITLTITVPNAGGDNALDTIYFNNFEVRAIASTSGTFIRNGGTFLINNSTANPTSAQPLGKLISDQPQMIYASSQAAHRDTSDILLSCGTDKQILEIAITVAGSCGALTVTQFNFNTTGDVGFSQNPITNIADAKLYYTGTSQFSPSQVFSPIDLFGSFGTSPSGTFTINGNKKLNSVTGAHYFYLTYSVPPAAIAGNKLDASIVSFVLGGITYTPSLSNPAGTRTISSSQCFTPDLPSPAANLQTVTKGSLVIPMDNANQSLNPPFNLKAYGLVHKLLMNDIPVKWVIKSGKTKDAIDFSAMSERAYPSFVAAAMIDYRASAFIIDSIYVNQTFNSFGTTAAQLITSFGNNVAVYRLMNDEVVDVRYTLDQRPKIAVFNNGGNQPIHIKMLDSAGVTNYVAISAGVFEGLPACYTFCSEPHWAATINDSAITQKVWDFVYSGGNFLAQCRGVEAYESNERFHTDNNIGILNTTVTNAYYNPDLAFMQYEGIVVSNQGGSERNWVRAVGSNWRNGFYHSISDGANKDTIVASGAHLVNSEQRGGNAFYLGGHDYFAGGAGDWTNIQQVNAARMYLNATLVPASRPTAFTLDLGGNQSTCQGTSIPLGGNPTGPSGATYTWTPATGLNNPNSPNPIATPLTTTTYTVLADNNGCPGNGVVTITVDSAPQVNSGIDQTVCVNNANVTLSGTVAGATGGVWSSLGTGVFSPGDSLLNTTYIPGSADTAAGTVNLILSSTGNPSNCISTKDTVKITFSPAPTANAGADTTVCATSSGIPIAGIVTLATGGAWSTGGTGTFSPDTVSLNSNYLLSGADTSAGIIKIILTTTGNGNCSSVSDTMNLIIAPDITSANAGNDAIVCNNISGIPLSGQVSGATGGSWSTPGSGTFSPSSDSLNTQYVPGSSDTVAGNVSLVLTTTGTSGCIAKTDTVKISFYPSVSVNAGNDSVMCSSDSSFAISGSVLQASGGIWSTSGNGTFSPNDSSLNATYFPGAADYLSGTSTLTLTSYGGCTSLSDTLILSIVPFANAGANQNICANDTDATLTGITSGGASVVWSTSGTGSFTPSDTILNPTYIITSADSTAGSVNLVLSVSGSTFGCPNATDTLAIIILPLPVVNAGNDTTMCSGDSSLAISGSVQQVSSGTWSTTGNGTFSPNDSSLNAIYFVGTSDYLSGTVALILTANGGCATVTDSLILKIVPFANAGADQYHCSSDTSAVLTGNSTGGASFIWTTSGTGSFTPSDTVLNTTYIITSADSANGSVNLVLSVSGSTFGCPNANDTIKIYILPPPVANAGTDKTVCSNNISLPLSGSIVGALGAMWSTSGNGVFTPDSVSLNATYIPGSVDTTGSTISLILTTTGSCITISDTLMVAITPAPVVNAGSDVSVCVTNANVLLNGSVTVAAGGVWSTGGSGIFLPNPNALNATYQPGSADTTAGSVAIILTSTGNGNCNAVVDSLAITYTPDMIAVNAGADTTICSDSVVLNGTVFTAGGGTWTTTTGGTFSPSDTLLATGYIFSSADTSAGSVSIVLTTTGNGGCLPKNDTVKIFIQKNISISATAPDTVCANGGSISLNGAVSTGSAVWTTTGSGIFQPNDSTLNASYTPGSADTAAGNVMLVLTSKNNGQCAAVTDTVNIILIPGPKADYTSTSVCFNNATTFTDATVITSGNIISWSWNFGDLTSDTSKNTSHTYSTVGTYSVILKVVSNNGCIDSATKTVIVHPLPILDFSTSAQCFVDSVSFFDWSGISSGTIVSWNWAFGDSTTSSLQNPAHLYGNAGTYSVSLTVTSDSGCTGSLMKTINIQPKPNGDFANTTACANGLTLFSDSSQISSGNIISWNWNFGDSTTSNSQNPTHTYSAEGTFTVTLVVVSDSGCADTIIKTVNVYSLPNAAFNSSAQCFVDSVFFTDLSAIGNGTINSWQWNFGDSSTSTIQNNAHNYSGPGIYTVTLIVTSASGCKDTLIQTVNVQAKPDAKFSGDTACANGYSMFTDSSTILIGNIISWNWNFGDTSSSAAQHPVHTYLSEGTFTATLIVTSDGGCKDTISKPVQVYALPDAKFNSTAQCFVDSVYFTDLSTITTPGNIVSWQWNFGDTTGSSIQSPSHVYASAGTYTATLIVTSGKGCADTLSQTLNVKPGPDALFGNNTVCEKATTLFLDSSKISTGTIVSWNWNFGDNTTSSSQNPNHVYSGAGNYTVTLLITSANGCTDTVSKPVIVKALPLSKYGYNIPCSGDATNFTDSSSVSNDSIVLWKWDFGDGSQSTNQHPSHVYSVTGSYAVTLIATSSFGCTDTLQKIVTVNPTPVAVFTPDKLIVVLQQPVNFADQSQNAVSWKWDFGEPGATSTQQSPSYIYSNQGGVFNTVLIITNSYGCTDTAERKIIVTMPPKVPNGFSPNGDGQNEKLYVVGGPYKKLDFKIWNNWGELIYAATNQSDGWDGTKEGVKQPMGVYIYTLIAVTEDDKQHDLHGDVTLLR